MRKILRQDVPMLTTLMLEPMAESDLLSRQHILNAEHDFPLLTKAQIRNTQNGVYLTLSGERLSQDQKAAIHKTLTSMHDQHLTLEGLGQDANKSSACSITIAGNKAGHLLKTLSAGQTVPMPFFSFGPKSLLLSRPLLAKRMVGDILNEVTRMSQSAPPFIIGRRATVLSPA